MRRDFTTTKIPKDPRILSVFEHCSTMLYPTHEKETPIQVTAIYLPPKKAAKVKIDLLRKLNRPRGNLEEEPTQPRVLGGDFNTTGWSRLYEEWLQEEGILD